MFYIHHHHIVSPHPFATDGSFGSLGTGPTLQLRAIEPSYTGIPPGALRRLSKSVKLGLGAALPVFAKLSSVKGIVIGTANAGMEDCYHFLKQLVDYDEGLLTPGSFVQSTPNALAAQLAMLSNNNAYNATHVHLGLAFENAALDVAMLVADNPATDYLLGAVDDISPNNYALNELAGWQKKSPVSVADLYLSHTEGSIAGEGAAMFIVNDSPHGASARVSAIHLLHTTDMEVVETALTEFLAEHLPAGEAIDLFISGENGDSRLLPYYKQCQSLLPGEAALARYKHLCGEYPTATSTGLWLACRLLNGKEVPEHVMLQGAAPGPFSNVLLYNTHKGFQHSFMLVTKP